MQNAASKGTVGVISGDPTFKEWHYRFTTITYKALTDQVLTRYPC